MGEIVKRRIEGLTLAKGDIAQELCLEQQACSLSLTYFFVNKRSLFY
jgi:hypothetical protein